MNWDPPSPVGASRRGSVPASAGRGKGLRVALAVLTVLAQPAGELPSFAQSLTRIYIGTVGATGLQSGTKVLHFGAPQGSAAPAIGNNGASIQPGFYSMPVFSPAAANDLAAAPSSATALALSFHATGEENTHFALKNSSFVFQYALSSGAPFGEPPGAGVTEVQVATTNVLPGAAANYVLSGLSPNTTFYVVELTKNRSNQYSPVSNISAAATYALLPGSSVITFVSQSTITVTWTSVPSNGYELDASSSTNFATLLASSVTADGTSTSLSLTGLNQGTTYQLRLGSINLAGAVNYEVLPSTRTLGLSEADWTGLGANSLASNAANWFNNTLPQSGASVILGSSGPTKGMTWDLPGVVVNNFVMDVTFSSSVTLGADLQVGGGMQLSSGVFSQGAFNVTVGGNWTQGSAGAFVKGAGALTFNGSGAQAISSPATPLLLPGLVIAKATGSTITVSGVDVQADGLTINSGAIAFVNGLSSSTINGPVALNGASSVLQVAASTVSVLGSNAVTVTGGRLDMHQAGVLKAASITVQPGGALKLYDDTSAGAPYLTHSDAGGPLSMDVAGTIDVSSAVLDSLASNGLQLESSANIITLSSVTFRTLTAGATALTLLDALSGGATFYNLSFQTPAAANAWGPNLAGTVTFRGATGVFAGSAFEADDNDLMYWFPDPHPDTTPPGALPSILQGVIGPDPQSIELTWASPGDDGMKGYLWGGFAVEYATASSMYASFSTAAAQVVIPAKKVLPGAILNYEVTGLNPGTTYYLAMWAFDTRNNNTLYGPISNLTTAYTAVAPATAILGNVTTAGGAGVNGVVMQALSAQGALDSTAFTNSSGAFELDGLVAGNYKVEASFTANGVTSEVSKDGIAAGAFAVNFGLAVDYTLSSFSGHVPLAVHTQGGGRYDVQTQASGRPFLEVYVGGRRVIVQGLESDGSFTVTHLLPGTYQVRVYNGLEYSRLQSVQLADGQNAALTLSYDLLDGSKVYNFPNPAKSQTTLRFQSGVPPAKADITVYDIGGNVVKRFDGSTLTNPQPGVYHADWDLKNDGGQSVASGVYLYEVKVQGPDGEVAKVVKKLAVIK